MKPFDFSDFEQKFYGLLWREDTLDLENLDRKFLYNGAVLRVKMVDHVITLVVCLGNKRILYTR